MNTPRIARFGAVLALSSLIHTLPLPAAHAQNGSPAAQKEQHVGSILTVPLRDFASILGHNATRQNNVNLLHVSQGAVGDLNTQVATISIRQKNNLKPAKQCWLPSGSLAWVKQANKNTTIVEQGVVGWGNNQAVQVEVSQESTVDEMKVPKGTRFMMVPWWGVASIQALNQTNLNVVRISQLAVGDENTQVAVVAIDQKNAKNLKVPGSVVGPLVQLNVNLTVINQVAVGNGNTQVATVSVGQENKL